MTKNNGFKVAALAASIALAMGSTAVMAATPTANQLPGAGIVKAGAATGGTIASGAQTITFTGNTVINWGVASGATINATTQPGGFNIGSTANLGFTDSAVAGSSVLNVDVSGNPSQIFGKLNMNAGGGNLYVANSNGIIVGATAQIAGPGEIGLIANNRGTVSFDGTASDSSIEFAGSGSDVSVAKGATITGATTVLVSGGGAVNVDLSAFTGGAATIQAGVKNSSSTLVDDNPAATLTATGTLGAATLAAFSSAGDASTSGTLTLGGNARVDGTLTNTGDLTLDTGFAIDGGLVNNKTATQAADASMGSLVNSGAYVGGSHQLTTTDGGISNGASMTGIGYVDINGGDFVNNGQFTSNNSLDVSSGGNVVNNGEATVGGDVDIYKGGDFTNAGTMDLTGDVYVVNGSITNSGKLSVDDYLETASNSNAGYGFTKAADYSITNTGTVTATGGDLSLGANSDWWGSRTSGTTKNDSTGSVSNTGILQVGAAGDIDLDANNDVNLAGTVQAFKGTKYAALSATNMLGNLEIGAGGWDGVVNTDGAATIATDLFTTSADVHGSQVKLMSNISADDYVDVIAGAKSDTDYAVRLASGKTVSAGNWIRVDGDQAGDEPNVILQGTLEANDIRFGTFVNAVSDVFTGPSGSLSLFDNGAAPKLQFAFTGAVKTVPYNNTPTNFRYNGLNVVTDGSVLGLTLNPVDYLTNGTTNGAKSAVNILVNGDVALTSPVAPSVAAGGSAVTGVTNIPNTHLVLQSSSNISTVGNFYWPGYVYLGTVAADADGNALPGTLGLGQIATGGTFNNVLPGDIAGASGIHFITQFPLNLASTVVTNANAWVNFGTDLLTAKYASEQGVGGPFFGGSQSVGTVVNYDELDPSRFHTAAPSAAR